MGRGAGQVYLPVMCDCRAAEARARSAARLSSALGALAGARWPALTERADWAEAELESFRSCLAAAREFARSPRYALALAGPTGNGKTTMLACIANDLSAAGQSPVFAKVPELLDRLRQSFGPRREREGETFDALYDELRGAGVLLLDDLGTENPTPWAMEKLYQLIDYRYSSGLPLAVTTNLRPAQLAALSDRIYSRLAAFVVVNRTPDYRVPKGW